MLSCAEMDPLHAERYVSDANTEVTNSRWRQWSGFSRCAVVCVRWCVPCYAPPLPPRRLSPSWRPVCDEPGARATPGLWPRTDRYYCHRRAL